MLTSNKVLCNGRRNSRCEKRKRATYDSLCNNGVNSAVMERGKDVQENLSPEFPSFIKCMLPSHVSGGFWLGLPKKFCSNYLPKQDAIIVLEDESGKDYETKYLVEKIGLSAGWRGFSIAHRLVERDVLIFHLVRPSKFKQEWSDWKEKFTSLASYEILQNQVYIVRFNCSDEVDAALGILKLDTCHTQKDSAVILHKDYHAEKGIITCEEEDKYWEPLALDIPKGNYDRHSHEPVSGQSEDDSKDLGSEILDGIQISESAIDFKDVKSVEDFSIVVNGLIINSALSKHLRTKYYELCSSQKSFLHNCLLDGLNCKLTAGMISETINIADAIRASKLTTSEDDFAIWDNTLKAFKMMGMNVGFLQARLDQLMNLTSASQRSRQARIERAHAEEEKRILEMKLSEIREKINKLDREIEALEMSSDRLEVMFQKVAKASW